MMAEELRRGWCPGALRPMLSGDGYIVRIRPRGPVIPQALAYALADLADRFGNGLIDLTARANLQLRGVREETFQPLQTALADLGLLDTSIAQEARRNILRSPLCGIDPTAALDSRPLYTALEAWLMNDDTLAALPGKFGFGIDEGGLLPLPADASDLHARAQRTSEGPRWAVFAGGHRLITCHPDDCLPVMKTLSQTFFAPHARGGADEGAAGIDWAGRFSSGCRSRNDRNRKNNRTRAAASTARDLAAHGRAIYPGGGSFWATSCRTDAVLSPSWARVSLNALA
ncbi:hypothetical protein [Elstera litoralis]|uniref:hypothetical protein n=1 Tax=Elstera litoralis TaxID=552518 RepID=UPI0006981D9A|nr:hypothetical protein [Elstera litoralis]